MDKRKRLIMNKEKLLKEIEKIINLHYNNEVDSKDESLREIIYLRDNVKELLESVDLRKELLHYHEYLQDNLSMNLNKIWVSEFLKRR